MEPLRLRDRELALDHPLIVGILNVTPDSFSDGGRFLNPAHAVEHALLLSSQGADIIDVGGESTRPGAQPVDPTDELRRVIPVISAAVEHGLVVSIDTRHALVARESVACGAHIINDVSGLRDPKMREVAAEFGVPAVVMHMPVDDPTTMQAHTSYSDVVTDVIRFLQLSATTALTEGVGQIILDPGLGFGKTTAHNVELIRRLDELAALGYPVLIGASRKRMIGELTGIAQPSDRDPGSIAIHLMAVDNGALLVRVHDVAGHKQALDTWSAFHR